MIRQTDAAMLEETAHLAQVRGRSLWQDARVRFFRNKAAVVGLIVLIAIACFALFGGLIAQYEPDFVDFSLMGANAYQGVPSIETGHYFGTDIDGRDLFARTVQGTGISLLVGIVGSLVAVVVGTLYGATAGYVGGRTDSIMMRIVDILMSIPFMFVLILMLVIFGRSILMLFIGIGLISWLNMARIARGQTLTIKNKEFVEAAVATGVRPFIIILRHIVPNLLGIVIVYATLLVPEMIIFESFISYLGLGVQEPMTSLGALINGGAQQMNNGTLWMLFYPLAFFLITLFAFFFVGDGLRDALDPKIGNEYSAEGPLNMLLDVSDLTVTFRTNDGPVHAVNGLSFAVDEKETLAIVGESGSGKSQTAFAIMGLLAKNGEATGHVGFDGTDLLALSPRQLNKVRAQKIAMIFQDPMTSLNPYLRVSDQMAEVLQLHKGMSKRKAVAEAAQMLDAVRIPDAKARISMYPHEFSGGMRQRIMIAIALLCRPRLLIADEPTTALDVTVQAQIMELLAEIREEFNTAMILITHDLGIVAGSCDKTLVLYGGQIMEQGGTEAVFAEPSHPYTKGLLRAVPRIDRDDDALLTIAGEPPDMSNLPAGCPFSPRCDIAKDKCSTIKPVLEQSGARKRACHADLSEVDNV